jgi:hypothetical protein
MPIPTATYPEHTTSRPLHTEEVHQGAPQTSTVSTAESYPRPPVLPAGSYQNPDGGITYIYPTEVIKKYMSNQATDDDAKKADPTDAPCNVATQVDTEKVQSIPVQSLASMPASLSGSGHDVRPSIATAVYANYPPLPPPAERMPQASFVFSSQGAVQHIEPTPCAPGPRGPPGVGLVQAAAAVVAHGYHSPNGSVDSTIPVHDGFGNVSTAPRYFPPPISPTYPYPQIMYGTPFPQAVPGGMSAEYVAGLRGGGSRHRRGSQGIPRPPYGPNSGFSRTGIYTSRPQDSM